MDRRGLILGALSACLPVMSRPTFGATEKGDYELIVVGAGVAGLTAACLAKQLGIHRILILESEPLIGGSSLICGGFWAVSETEFQKQLGIKDSDQAFYRDILEVGGYQNDESLVRAFINNNRLQYEWVLRQGVAPKSIAPGAGTMRAHVFDPRRVIERLYRNAVADGTAIEVSQRVRKLLYDPACRRVTGVCTDCGLYRARAVLLACGGFARNKALLEKYSPQMRFASSISAQGSRGDGILMAQAVGADLADMKWLAASYAFIQNPTTIDDMTFVNYHGGIIVNKYGKRFVDESLPYKLIAREVLKQANAKSFIVFDEAIRRISAQQPIDRRLWNEVPMASGPTLEQAAVQCAIDPEALKRTVHDYNQAVRSGMNPQRGPISVNQGRLLEINTPPFYILPASLCLLGTYCGVKINDKAQVVDTQGEIIDGLWAAGEVTGGFHGASFIMGTAYGKAQTFARIAAENIARKIQEE